MNYLNLEASAFHSSCFSRGPFPFPFATSGMWLHFTSILKFFLSLISFPSNISRHIMPFLHPEYLPYWHSISSFSVKLVESVILPFPFAFLPFISLATPALCLQLSPLFWNDGDQSHKRPDHVFCKIHWTLTSSNHYFSGSVPLWYSFALISWILYIFCDLCDIYYHITAHLIKDHVSLFHVFAIVFQSIMPSRFHL